MPRTFKVRRLIDGNGGAVLEDAFITTEGEKILSIGPQSSYSEDSGGEVMELGDATALPGLIDCHVHLDFHATPDLHSEKYDGDAYRTLKAARSAAATLQAGITTVRDVGARNFIDMGLKRAIKEGLVPGPHLLVSGKIISITAAGLEYYEGMYHKADGQEEVRKAAREQIRAGADWIKMMGTGAVMTPDEEPGVSQFNEEEIRVAVEEGKKFRKRVAVHAHGADGVKSAARAGVNTIEHGSLLDDESIEVLLEAGTFLVPTVKLFDYMIEGGEESGIPSFIVEKAKWVRERAIESLLKAWKAGVKVAMGTDAGTPFNYHGRNAEEVVFRASVGIPSLEAIMQATKISSEALGLQGVTGTLEPGKVADILIVDGNPLTDVRVLSSSVSMVVKAGQVVYSKGTSTPDHR